MSKCKREPIMGGWREAIEDGLAAKAGAAPVLSGRRRAYASHYRLAYRRWHKRLREDGKKLGRYTEPHGKRTKARSTDQ